MTSLSGETPETMEVESEDGNTPNGDSGGPVKNSNYSDVPLNRENNVKAAAGDSNSIKPSTDENNIKPSNVANTNITKDDDVRQPGSDDNAKTSVEENSKTCTGERKLKMKKDDSGISVEKCDSSSDDDALVKKESTSNDVSKDESSKDKQGEVPSFPKIKLGVKRRNYRLRNLALESDSKSSDEEEMVLAVTKEKPKPVDSPDSGNDDTNAEGLESEENAVASSDTSEASANSDSELSLLSVSNHKDELETLDEEDEDKIPMPPALVKEKPKHKWFVINEVINRQRGVSSHFQESELFQQRCYGSLHCVKRLELMYKLKRHTGCVNTLNFNSSGTLLASGSDDLKIVIWNWPVGEHMVTYDSGHRSNVFQVKFLPLSSDTHVVSCSRDGQVRLAELSSTGVCKSTRRLAQHRSATHKLTVNPELPHVVLSAGEDGLAMSMDVRQAKADKLVVVMEGDRKIPLYSIHSNPLNCSEFCVAGRDNYVRVFDRRNLSDGKFVKRFCPLHLVKCDSYTHITCAMYNYNGSEILASYNDDDIYLFDTRLSENEDYIHKYSGHRNNATVKGVSFFGPKSEYIVSGSDCSNIYFWEKETECIIQWMPGDENGVVNCLEPHPQLPVLATSGLDDDIKVWVPSCEQEPKMKGLKRTVAENIRNRETERNQDTQSFDGQMLWILWRQIRRNERRRRERAEQAARNGVSENSDNSESSESDDDDDESRVQCSPS